MNTQNRSLYSRWKRNFGRGVYALVILAMVAVAFQLVAYLVCTIALVAFPALEAPENANLFTILGLTGFVLAGIPFIGFLFTSLYEREAEDTPDSAGPAPASRETRV